MPKFLRLTVASLLLSTMSSAAMAQEGVSVGGRIYDAIDKTVGPLVFLISLCSFAGGLWFMAKGLVKLKDVAAGQGRNEGGHAILCLMAATALICLPEIAGVGMTSVFGNGGIFGNDDLMNVQRALDSASGDPAGGTVKKILGMGAVVSPSNCLGGSSANGESPAACMAGNVAKNVAPIGVMAIFVFGFLMGLVIFASCIHELTKGEQGQRSPGFWGKMLGSVLLMNAIFFFQAFSNTMLGLDGTITSQGGVQTGSDMMKYTPSGSTVLAQYATLIGYCFLILTFFGAFAFLKGIFLIKDASEGRGQATYSHGMVFLVAGILLANAKYSTCLVIMTITGADTAGFCS